MGSDIYLYFNNEELQTLVKLSGTTDKKAVTKWIKQKALTEIKQSQEKDTSKKSLDDLKKLDLTIKCWKGLLEIRDSVPFKIDPMEILQGTQTLEAPQLTVLNNGTTQQEQKLENVNKISWFHICKVGNIEREIAVPYKCGHCGEVDSYGK